MDAVVFIAVRGSFWATQFVLSPIRRLFWHKQLMGAYHKSRRDERLQTGVITPGNCATTQKVPKGRQKPKQVVIEQVRYSIAPSGLWFVAVLLPGVGTPVCGLSHLRCLFPGQQ